MVYYRMKNRGVGHVDVDETKFETLYIDWDRLRN
jgi:hypothetical protein